MRELRDKRFDFGGLSNGNQEISAECLYNIGRLGSIGQDNRIVSATRQSVRVPNTLSECFVIRRMYHPSDTEWPVGYVDASSIHYRLMAKPGVDFNVI